MRARRGQRGFTLIEILVALVITVLGLSAVAGMFVANAQGTSYARHATEASVLAEDQLELMLTTPSANLVSGFDRVDEHGVVVVSGGFSRVWTVAWDGNLARIAVTVTWREGDSNREMVFRTLRSR
jgi:type IV pilus assembly protein PilV